MAIDEERMREADGRGPVGLGPIGQQLDSAVRAHLKRWGVLEDWDRTRASSVGSEASSLTPQEEFEIRSREAREAREARARSEGELLERAARARRSLPERMPGTPLREVSEARQRAAEPTGEAPALPPVSGTGPFSRLLPKAARLERKARVALAAAEAKAEANRAELAGLAERERARAPLYIRFGDAPERASSIGPEERARRGPRFEGGVSVFRGRRDPDGAYVVDVGKGPAQLDMYKRLALEGRPVYLASGREVGFGSDGEPVLADVEYEPLPDGSVVRCSGEWQGSAAARLAAITVLSGFNVTHPRWAYAPPPEIRVSAPPRPEPFGGDLATAPGRLAFVEAVLARSTAPAGAQHGPEHWKRAAAAGAGVCRKTPGADPLAVFLFSVTHDAARVHDAGDGWHGWRAARLARALLGGHPALAGGRLGKLLYALEHHDAGETSEDPTVGACWDGDRLCVWRVWEEPDPALLSTAAARAPATIAWARGLQAERFTWPEVIAMFPTDEEADGDG